MQIFGLQISVTKAPPSMSSVAENRGGWTPWIREPFAGAFQRDIEWTTDTVLAHHAVYSCITLIANDIGKLRPMLVQQDENGIWSEVTGQSPYSAVLKKPNRYQNHIQFKEWWTISKLVRGNTYALKQRDNRGIVTALYLLDPSRVQVLVASDGSVYYALGTDNLTGLTDSSIVVPASEIIHDRINCLFHPLVGVSPIFASGAAANVGLRIESNSAGFFGNGSNPSGVITAPGTIPQETANRMKEYWDNHFSGVNAGKVAVLGDNLSFTPMRMTAVDSQLIEQLRWTAETVCSTFHVPPWKIHVGAQPAYTSPQTASLAYYSDCLQSHIEQYELCMDEGLGIGLGESIGGKTLGVELDVEEGLLRMDPAARVESLVKASGGPVMTPDEARKKVDLGPLVGGSTIYKQHQDYPIEQVFNRTDLDAPKPAPTTPAPAPVDEEEPEVDEDEVRAFLGNRLKSYYPEALAA